ncbi:hypothetical protein [Deinococcus planocerae]|uniref:hypothetical protein n=1 Tax=Deinococcus planocerae TaxID=1737569 RepID=UPI0015E0C5BE|nr:hypothetical protein [Deinococcus planocerae]
MNVLAFGTLLATGFTACAEFGSYAFVHPVIRHLPPEQHLRVEKGLLRTFGRVMPTLMTACVVLSWSFALTPASRSPLAQRLLVAAAVSLGAARRGGGRPDAVRRPG